MCLSHLIDTVGPYLIHTCHAMPMPCSDHAVLLKATARPSLEGRAVLCCRLEKNGMVVAWHGHGMAGVNQTRPHCVNQMRKTHSKPLAARHGRGTAWEGHAMCEWALLHPPIRARQKRQSRLGAQYVRLYETPGFIDHDHKTQQFLPIPDEPSTNLQTLFISYQF